MLIKLSESKRSTYAQCPKKYYYQYIDRTKVPRKVWDHFEIGLMAHKAMEYFHSEWTSTLQDKIAIMSQAVNRAQATYHTNHQLADMVRVWLNAHVMTLSDPPNIIPKGIERSFYIDIGNGIQLNGRIDRIDQIGDRQYRVVDYKTGAKDTYEPFQLKMYAYAISHIIPNIAEPIQASVISLRSGMVYDHLFSFQDLEEVPRRMGGVATTIKSDTSWVAQPSDLCKWCDFRHICPHAQ